jgi:hypothetical protein
MPLGSGGQSTEGSDRKPMQVNGRWNAAVHEVRATELVAPYF